METVNMHEAKTRLSQLVAAAVKDHPFIIAKAGKPLVKVEALDDAAAPVKSRVGFLEGCFTIPYEPDPEWDAEIAKLFNGEE